MKWDIDKAVAALVNPDVTTDFGVGRVVVDQSRWKEFRLRPENPKVPSVMAWSLSIGRFANPKIFAYGLTIREAYLNLRKSLKGKTPEELEFYGLRKFKKKVREDRRRTKKRINGS